MSKKQYYAKFYKNELDNNSCLEFDGVNQYVGIPDSTDFNFGAGAFTFECWIKPDSVSGIQVCMGRQEVGADGWIGLADDVVRFTNGNAVNTNSVMKVSPNIWIHIAGVFDGTKIKLYINGNFESENTNVESAPTTGDFQIARFASSFYYDGKIDDVRIWNVARTESEIFENYNRKLTGNEIGLVAYYTMDDGFGTTIDDNSTNNHTGTLYNTPTWIIDKNYIAPISRIDYKGFFPDFIFSNFQTTINGGYGDLTLKLPIKFDDSVIGDMIDYNVDVQISVYDKQQPQGQVIYRGYILEWERALLSNKETVSVTVAGYYSKLSFDYLRDTSGDYSLSWTSTEIKTIIQNILTYYNVRTDFKILEGDVETTGKSVDVSFNYSTYVDVLSAIYELSDKGWYYFVDATNSLNFKQFNTTTPDHLFIFGKDVIDVEIKESLEEMKNTVIFWNEVDTIALEFYNAESVNKYGRQVDYIMDERYNNVSSITEFATNHINKRKDPYTELNISVVDDNEGFGYDIETLQVGQTFKIKNMEDKYFDEKIFVITRIVYEIDQIKITAGNLKQTIEKVWYDLQSSQNQINRSASINPTSVIEV